MYKFILLDIGLVEQYGCNSKMKRKYFIKDLFNPRNILDKFNELEFESFNVFVRLTQSGIYTPTENQEIIIPIQKEEIEPMNTLLTESYLCDKTNVSLYMKWETLEEFIKQLDEKLAKKLFTIIVDEYKDTLMSLYELNDNFRIWTHDNPIWAKVFINYENYKRQLNDIISLYNKKKFRFFKLIFDYASFDQINLKEIRGLEWRIGQFMQWYTSTRQDKKYDVDPLIVNRKAEKTLFVGNDLKLYVNKEAFKDKAVLFDLAEHLEDDGESIDFHDLADLRVYMDLQFKFLIPQMRNYYFVDFYQNRKILGEYIEIPLICQLITRWLNV